MNFMRFFFVAVIILFVLPGCQLSYKKSSGTTTVVKKLSVVKPFKIKIDGVECRLCAQEIERVFLSLPDFYGVKFLHLMGNYEAGYLRCYLTKGGCNIDMRLINKIVTEKDFICSTIEGEFIGRFIEKDDQRLFVLDGQENVFFVSDQSENYVPISDEYWAQLEKDKQIRMSMKVVRNEAGWWWVSI